MKPGRADFTAALLRTFAVQGSWNYRTLIGAGIAYALSPLLVRIHTGDPVALRAALVRHADAFNAHPYLSPVAVGALARLEHEGEAVETIERFRTALRGPLGAIGDQAVWAGWRPFCLFAAVIAYGLGLDARWSALAFLVTYNAGHFALRVWGFRRGWRDGLTVGRTLAGSPVKRLGHRLARWNPAVVGAAAGILAGRFGIPLDATSLAVASVLGLGAYFLPFRGGQFAVGLLFTALAVWHL